MTLVNKTFEQMNLERDLVMYHYTNEEGWEGIKNSERGLQPDQPSFPVIYGLFEPYPASWLTDDFTWKTLMHHCIKNSQNNNIILLKVNLKQEDNPIVLDYSYVLSGNVQKYVSSKIPLSKYNNNHTLPEVVVFNHIPLERIDFVWKKNLYQFLNETSARGIEEFEGYAKQGLKNLTLKKLLNIFLN